MGKNRRQERLRQRRDQSTASPSPAAGGPPRASKPAGKPKAGWRQTLDSWGGFPVAGALGLVVVALAVLIWVNRPGATAGGDPYEPQERVQVNGRVEGDPNAPVKIIEFADFQCPFCKRFTDDTSRQLVEEFVNTGIASIEFRHFAFLGPDSVRAAEAAECAADQNRFWEYHDILFLRQGAENTGVYSTANLKSFAREIADAHEGFDLDAFDSCVDSGAKRAAVEEMTRQADALGIQSTPSFLVNGTPLSGAQPIENFRAAIAAAQGQ
ncbi:MAG: thioredoxin domain-containing protein [Dehalococcoidia bacterium]|nr:thioredoxin domain-containing protein [Dehalococcoidia bacterium]